MSLLRGTVGAFGAATLLTLAASACGDKERSPRAGVGSSPTGNDVGGSSIGGNSALGGSLFQIGGAEDIGPTCAGDIIQAEAIPLDMYVMLDVSGSMLEATEGDPNVTKWQAARSALQEFVADEASAGIGMGLQVFPLKHPDAPTECTTNAQCGDFGPCFLKICWGYPDGIVPCSANRDCGNFGPCEVFGECAQGDYVCAGLGRECRIMGTSYGTCLAPPPSYCLAAADCRPASYAAPESEIAVLPGAEAPLLAALARAQPSGENLTPSGPALQGAIDHARAWAAAHPGRQVVTVLATDGLPTECLPVEIADVAQVAADGLSATPGVATFVIGVVGSADLDAPANLHSIAEAGGTAEAFIIDSGGDVAAQFRAALAAIRASRLACELAVPVGESDRPVDYGLVNVEFDDGSRARRLYYVKERSGCDPTEGGWYYDTDPTVSAPQRIVVCPSTCRAFGETTAGLVQIELGCRSIVK